MACIDGLQLLYMYRPHFPRPTRAGCPSGKNFVLYPFTYVRPPYQESTTRGTTTYYCYYYYYYYYYYHLSPTTTTYNYNYNYNCNCNTATATCNLQPAIAANIQHPTLQLASKLEQLATTFSFQLCFTFTLLLLAFSFQLCFTFSF